MYHTLETEQLALLLVFAERCRPLGRHDDV